MKTKSFFSFVAIVILFVATLSAQEKAKVSILGDSYSTFYGYITPDSNRCWYCVPDEKRDNDVKKVEETWWHHLINEYDLQLEINNSYSGATICNTGYNKSDYSDRSFITRMSNLGAPNIILIFGGTNDSWAGAPMGDYKYSDWSKAELYSFRPAFCNLLDYISKHYPQAKIYNITNTELSNDVTTSMAEICLHYKVTNILLHDIDKQSGHPSVKGMKSISEQVWNGMKQ